MGEITQKLVIESRLDATVRARRWVTDQARMAGFDKESVFAIELAVGEALANIIEHAYQNKPGRQIHLMLTIDEVKLFLIIRDFGRKFDLNSYHPPDLDEAKEGGYGVYLIEQMMDEVRYEDPAGQGTQLGMIKYRTTTKDGRK